MYLRFFLFIVVLAIAPQILAADFPTGYLKGIGFVVENGNTKLTNKDLYAYSSSATVVKQADGSYQFTIVAHLQRKPATSQKTDKRVDLYKVIWESPTSGKLVNTNLAYSNDKTNFSISKGELVMRSWIARNQLWETQFYSLAK